MHLHFGITSDTYSSYSNITFIPQVLWHYSGFPAYGHFRSLRSIPVQTTSFKFKGSSWMENLNWLQLVSGVGPNWLHVETAKVQLKPAEMNTKRF